MRRNTSKLFLPLFWGQLFTRSTSSGKWSSLTSQKQFMDQLANQLNIKIWQEWYNVKYSDVEANGGNSSENDSFNTSRGRGILEYFDFSLKKLLMTVYSELPWNPYLFGGITRKYWEDKDNQLKFLHFLEKRLNITDWYSVKPQDIIDNGGASLLTYYSNSLCLLLMNAFPEREWIPWKLPNLPISYWEDKKNQRKFIEWLGKQLNIQTHEEWYSVNKKIFRENGASGLLRLYKEDITSLLNSLFPEYKWDSSSFAKKDLSFWNEKEVQRNFFDRIAKNLQIESYEDWYKVKAADIKAQGGNYILKLHDSYIKALLSVYPEHNWEIWRFHSVPPNLFKEKKIQFMFFESLGKKLGIKKHEDWYSITKQEVKENGGANLLKEYGDSLSKALISIFPEYKWDVFKFRSKDYFEEENREESDSHLRFWKDKKVQLDFFNKIFKTLELKTWEDWYQVKTSQVKKLGGSTLLKLYGNSLIQALVTIYPENNWKIWKFDILNSHFWSDPVNQRAFLENIKEDLQIKQLTDWHSISKEDIKKKGGTALFQVYSSMFDMLSKIYPEHAWVEAQFTKEEGYWKDKQVQKRFFDDLFKKLDMKSLEVSDVQNHGGSALLKYYGGSLIKALESCYPEHNWKETTTSHSKLQVNKTQKRIFSIMQETFPDLIQDIHMNYQHPDLLSSKSGQRLELDIFIPSISLALEYQGEQHYAEYKIFAKSIDNVQELDSEKRNKCKKLGITLVEIPYWWDGTKERLLATIKQIRPDVIPFPVSGKPISEIQ